MNDEHARLCASPQWAVHIADEVLPQVLDDAAATGGQVLEIGPGYGAATVELARIFSDLTVVEVDKQLATDLAARFPAVTVIGGDGTGLPFPDARFSAVLCFTMLHHVQDGPTQDALLAEARRVLAPGGVFAGSDSIATPDLHQFHANDTYVPVDPTSLPQRLSAAGFVDADVRVPAPGAWFTFRAQAPQDDDNTP